MNSTASSFVRGLVVIGVIALAGLLFLATPGEVQANVCTTSGGSTSWSNASAWTCDVGTTPQTGDVTDTVTISHNITLDTNVTVGSVTVNGGTFAVGDGTLDRTLTIQGDLTVTNPGVLNPGVGNNYLIISGDVVIGAGAVFTAPVGITLGGDWINNSLNFTAGTGTAVRFVGTASTIGGTRSTLFMVLRVDAAQTAHTVTINAPITVNDRIDIVRGTMIQNADNLVSCAALTMSQNAVFNIGGTALTLNCASAILDGGSVVDFKGTVDQDIPAFTYGNLYISETTSTRTTTGAVTAKNNLTISNGRLNVISTIGHFGATPGTFTLDTGAILEFSGNGSFLGSGQGLFDAGTSVLATGSVVQYSRGNPQTISLIPETWTTAPGYAGLFISNSNVKSLAGDLHVRENLNIDTGATLAITGGPFTLYVGGQWINDGTFTPNTNTVQFNGTQQQNIQGEHATTFYNLTINNTGGDVGGVVMACNLPNCATITNTLNFLNGRIILGQHDMTMASTATAVTGTLDASRMVIADDTGRMCRNYVDNTPYTFPVGDQSQVGAELDPYQYSPAREVSIGLGTSDTGCVNLRNARHPQFPASIENYINRYWTLSRSGGTPLSAASAIFVYDAADVVGTEDLLEGMKYSAGAWTIGYGVDWFENNYITFTGLTEFSDFTAGDHYPTAVNVEYFRARKTSGGVELAWKTIDESDVSGFSIFRREPGGEYVKLNVTAIPSMGSGSEYTWTDASAVAGKRYEYLLESYDTQMGLAGAPIPLVYWPYMLFLSLVH